MPCVARGARSLTVAVRAESAPSKVSGVTMPATSARAFLPSALAFRAKSPALIVIEAHSPAAELLAKHPILLAEIFNDLQLAVVHPPGNGDQQELEWVKHSLCQNPLSRPPSRSGEISHLQADPVFGPYEHLSGSPIPGTIGAKAQGEFRVELRLSWDNGSGPISDRR